MNKSKAHKISTKNMTMNIIKKIFLLNNNNKSNITVMKIKNQLQ